MAILAHEGAHKTFGFSTLKIWLKGVIICLLGYNNISFQMLHQRVIKSLIRYQTSGTIAEDSQSIPPLPPRCRILKSNDFLFSSLTVMHIFKRCTTFGKSLKEIKSNRMGCTDEIPNIRDHGKMPKSPQDYGGHVC